MSDDDAARLVNLIVATWPTGPRAYVWTQALAGLDAPGANRAYTQLRDTVERITVASYLDVYRARRSPPRLRRRDPSEHCEHCRGSGWEDGPPEYETIGGQRHEYTTLQPCRCTLPTPPRASVATPSLLEEF